MVAIKAGRQLLILDEDNNICVALARHLVDHFDAIFTASDFETAIDYLCEKKITHLICDQQTGFKWPATRPNWRKNYPSIKKVVLLAFCVADFWPLEDGVDALLPKVFDMKRLTQALNVEGVNNNA